MDAIIRLMQAEMVEMWQVLMANNLKMPAQRVDELSFEVRVVQGANLGVVRKASKLYHIMTRRKVRATVKPWLQAGVWFH